MNGGVFMQAQVKTWGNSQGIRISKDVLQMADIINITDAIQGIFDYV